MAKRKAPFKRVQDDPRWKPGAWVFCTQPYGFYTLSICAGKGCGAGPMALHAFPGLLTREEYGGGTGATVAERVRAKMRLKDSTIDVPSITITACMLLPEDWREGEVPDGEAG